LQKISKLIKYKQILTFLGAAEEEICPNLGKLILKKIVKEIIQTISFKKIFGTG
jgi:hypothetical protein